MRCILWPTPRHGIPADLRDVVQVGLRSKNVRGGPDNYGERLVELLGDDDPGEAILILQNVGTVNKLPLGPDAEKFVRVCLEHWIINTGSPPIGVIFDAEGGAHLPERQKQKEDHLILPARQLVKDPAVVTDWKYLGQYTRGPALYSRLQDEFTDIARLFDPGQSIPFIPLPQWGRPEWNAHALAAKLGIAYAAGCDWVTLWGDDSDMTEDNWLDTWTIIEELLT